MTLVPCLFIQHVKKILNKQWRLAWHIFCSLLSCHCSCRLHRLCSVHLLFVYVVGNRSRRIHEGVPNGWLSHNRIKLKIMEGEVRPLLLDPQCSSMLILPWDPLRAKKSGIMILVSVTLERLAYFAVVMNLFLYLNKGQPEVLEFDLFTV